MILLDLINVINDNTSVCLWDDNGDIIAENSRRDSIPDDYLNCSVLEITAGYFKIDITLKGVKT